MATNSRNRRWSRAAGSIGALLLSAALARPCQAEPEEDPEDNEWAEMEQALRVLWTGDPAARREVADDAYSLFDPLFESESGGDDAGTTRILSSLKSLARSERDDFITYRLLGELAGRDGKILMPLFLDALKSPSPNLRWRGIQWFAQNPDATVLSELEYLFRHEDRPWVKADLMLALARHGSRDDSRDFLDLARGKDSTLALAAIRALTMIGDPEVIPFLVRIARASRSNAGLLALDALARWPDSREALEAVLEASRSPHVNVQRHAADLLGRFVDPAARERAYDLAAGHGDGYVRSAALGSLKGRDPALLVPLTIQILRAPPTEENAPAQSAAIRILHDLDDPSVLPELAGLGTDVTDSYSRQVFWLRWYLGRKRAESPPDPEPRIEVSEGTDTDLILTEEEPEVFVIAPPPSMLTVRCWEYPDVAGDPQTFVRLAAEGMVKVTDHFETERESWVQIDRSCCWIPARFIGEPRATRESEESSEQEETVVIRREFDLPADEVESDVARGLMEAGLLEVIEPGDEVTGVALRLDPEDFDRILLLARSCGLNETMLDGEIYQLVSDVAPLYRGHPVLDRFRRAVQTVPGENDDVVDLEMEELSDR